MQKYFYYYLICLLFSCTDKPKIPVVPDKHVYNERNNYEAVVIKNWKTEYISYDSVLLNGVLPIVTTKKKLYEVLGKPDKIIPMALNQNNRFLIAKGDLKKGNYLIYGNTVFEQYGEDIIANTIDFKSTNVEFVHPRVTLKKGMRSMTIQGLFPESGRLISGGGHEWSSSMMVSAYKPNHGIRDVWFLVFEAFELRRIILYATPTLYGSTY